jgi:hypothetical protein
VEPTDDNHRNVVIVDQAMQPTHTNVTNPSQAQCFDYLQKTECIVNEVIVLMNRLCSIINDLQSPFYTKKVRQAVLKELIIANEKHHCDVLNEGVG